MQRAIHFPAAKGGDDPATQCRSPTQSLHAPAEVDVFHQGNIGEPAQLFEDMATNENRLIPGGDAGPSRAPVHHGADYSSPARRTIKGDIKATSNDSTILQRSFDVLLGGCWQPGVGMHEEEDLATTGLGSFVQLPPAPPWGFDDAGV